MAFNLFSRIKKKEEQDLVCGTDLSSYYGTLKTIQQYHRNNPSTSDELMAKRLLIESYQQREADNLENIFSGEEHFGKFMDLHFCHESFNNLKGCVQKLDYFSYLKEFDNFLLIDRSTKLGADYKE